MVESRTEIDRPQKIAMTIAERLVHDIASQQLEPGSKLPPERDMLAEFGVGRGTLREALRYLELQGVIALKPGPGGGPIVAAPSDRQLASTLALLLEMHQSSYAEILSAQVTLEPVLAAQAAKRVTAAQVKALQAEVDEMRSSLDRPELFTEQHHRFHRLVVEAAGNHVFVLIMSSLHLITVGNIPWSGMPDRDRTAVVEQHQKIVDALSARDADAAYAAMLDHDKKYERQVTRNQAAALSGSVRWGSRLI